jgi:3-methyladenine DNA glycosylase/8-oxoguanine DNA glycosylase
VVRQRSAKPSSAGSIPAVASNFPTPHGFSFPSTVVSHGWYLLAPFRWSRDELILRRPEILGGKAVDLEISHDGRALIVQAAPMTGELRAKLTRMFQLHLDLSDFVAMARRSEPHAWVEGAGFGRLLCGSTLFEDAVKIILTTNTMWRQTMRMAELLVGKCGRRTAAGFAAFPEPEDVARVSPAELQEECRLGYRAKTIHALASGMAAGTIGAPNPPDLDTEELFAAYRKLPGIGPYGAAHLLAMDGRHDFIAVDTEFRRFVRERYHNGRAITERTMLRRYARWGRWKYLAYWSELWSSVAEHLQPLEKRDR